MTDVRRRHDRGAACAAATRAALAILLAAAAFAQTGCFWLTRTFLRRTEPYSATTRDCRIATVDDGTSLYLRFDDADFAKIGATRPWLPNPVAVRFARRSGPPREIGPADHLILRPWWNGRSEVPGIAARFTGVDLSDAVAMPAAAITGESRTFRVSGFNRRYSRNPLRYCAAPFLVVADIVANTVSLGFYGAFQCALEDEGDRRRAASLVLQPIGPEGAVVAPARAPAPASPPRSR